MRIIYESYKKLAIPAIILAAISGNMCSGSESWAKTLDPSLSKSDRIRMEDFLPHTFWCQSAKDIIAYLKPQILEKFLTVFVTLMTIFYRNPGLEKIALKRLSIIEYRNLWKINQS